MSRFFFVLASLMIISNLFILLFVAYDDCYEPWVAPGDPRTASSSSYFKSWEQEGVDPGGNWAGDSNNNIAGVPVRSAGRSLLGYEQDSDDPNADKPLLNSDDEASDAEDIAIPIDDKDSICEWDSNVSSWFDPIILDDYGQYCLEDKLLHLYACGTFCKQAGELTIGRCIDNECKCCTMYDTNGWFTSRGYKTPCNHASPVHQGGCSISCTQQGAVRGQCESNNCMCFMNNDII